MKISFEKKVLLGFVINVLVVIASGLVFISRLSEQRNKDLDSLLNWVALLLFALSIFLLMIVYFIIRSQLRATKSSRNLLLENKQLLQSIIDNTTNPIFIKKINGEYLLVNKQFEKLFEITNEEIIGKTDSDFLPPNVAERYRNSDLEVVKKLRELKTEETIEQKDGLHTYIAVKFPLYDSSKRIYAIGSISTDITQRKKLEDSSKAADKFFNMSLDIMVIASNDKFLKINPSLIKILGYSEEELLSHSFFNYIHPEDLTITHKEIDKLGTGVLTVQFENRWICKDGTIKWLVWSASPDLSTGLLYAIANDVTESKEIQNSLQIAEKFFNLSYDMLAVGKGDYFIKVNPALTRTLGYNQKDLDNTPILTFAHPEDITASIEAIKKLNKGQSMVNYRARALCKNGSYKWLDWTSTLDPHTGLKYSIARDVTESIENEESLKMSNTFFNMSFDILTVTKEEHFIKINPAFTRNLGYVLKDLDKIKFIEFIHPDDIKVVNEMLVKLMEGVPVANFINRFRCKDGTYKWLDWNVNIDTEHNVLYSVARDITEEVRLEEEEKVIINNLYENEEKLRLVLENIGDGVIVANADKKIIMANYVANEIFGIEEGANISSNFTNHFQLYFPDEKTIFPSQNLPLDRALKGEITNDIDIILLDPEKNKKKRVLISGRPLIDQDNQVVAAVVTIKDISRYKEMEQELEKTESKYRQLIGFRKDDDIEKKN